MRQFGRRFIMQGLLMAGCLLALGASAHAQRWENAFGGPTTEETARNGVRPVTEGGYVAVGGSRDAALNLEDIYVVRTNNHGGLAWSKTFDIGRNDVATDIEEVRNAAGGTDGFIITGYTNHLTGGTCGASNDIFLLRIDRCGNVLWQNTYGFPTVDEYGWDVIRATVGGAGVNVGDFVVAGWQGNSPNRDGYLLRVTNLGVPLWGVLYRGVQNRDDYFYSLDEATIGAGAGEIIAAGGSTSYRAVANLDAWIVRVTGPAGVVLAASVFGSATTTEDLKSVQELNTGTFAGHVVAVGQTATGTSPDVYVLQADAALFPVVDAILGFCNSDEGLYVREIPGAAGAPSNIIVTGYFTPMAGWGHGGQDAFLQEFRTGDLALVGNMFVYGNANNDRGWSVEPVAASGACRTQGFIVAGNIQRPAVAPADPLQLYMFKTNAAKGTGCDRNFVPPVLYPPYDNIRQNPLTAVLTTKCTPPITCIVRTWIQTICPLIADGTVVCQIPSCVIDCSVPAPQAPDLDPEFSDRIPMNSGDAVHARRNVVIEK